MARVVNLRVMDATALDHAAIAIADVRARRGRLMPLPPALAPVDEAAGYAVQDRLRLHLAGRGFGAMAGFKIGCTTAVMQTYLGIGHPCAGGISTARIYADNPEFAACEFVRPGVECEIAVELGRDLRPGDAPFDRARVGEAVSAVYAAMEIVDDRYDDWRAMPLPTLIADDFFHAALVLGPRIADWRSLDLARLHGVSRVNGILVGSGVGADILGHPLDALVWLAEHRARRGLGLTSGDIVSLGSLTETRWLVEGDEAAIEIESLGTVRIGYGSSTP